MLFWREPTSALCHSSQLHWLYMAEMAEMAMMLFQYHLFKDDPTRNSWSTCQATIGIDMHISACVSCNSCFICFSSSTVLWSQVDLVFMSWAAACLVLHRLSQSMKCLQMASAIVCQCTCQTRALQVCSGCAKRVGYSASKGHKSSDIVCLLDQDEQRVN